MPRPPFLALALALVLARESAQEAAAQEAAPAPDAKGIAFFEKRIRPVLVQQCYQCHSADAKELGGKLRLDSRHGMLTGGESGPALVVGKPQESLIVKALRYDGLEMPPKKRLDESVVADFVKWVQMGAPDPRVTQTEAPPKDDEKLADPTSLEAGRKFWSFQPLARATPPKVKDAKWALADVDRFVLARLEQAGLKPVPDVEPVALARRLFIDLTGLPPSPEQAEAFVADYARNRNEACERLVDELLRSPHFGERWARHWLDIARYGESNGNVRNSTFPHAWRYRDYVIQAFNEDRPYNQFVTEQIAGDLMPAKSTAERDRQLIATGFLALGSKPNAQGNQNFAMDIVADQIEVVTTSVMALTVACARCHDHKYDPVPTRDYYALAGIFTSTETLYGATGNNMGGAPPTPLHQLSKNGQIPSPEPAEKDEDKGGKGGKGKKKNNNNRRAAGPAYPADQPLAMGVRDRASPDDCRINLKGESRQLGASVTRGFVEVCSLVDVPAIPADHSGRLQLAEWLTHPDHPLTARVFVNRVWHHLFGQGLVRTPDNFGLHGERPTHPELLDFLARQFVADGWSTKKLIRSLVLSRTYRLSSRHDEASFAADPDNLLLWRHPRRRLDAESFRDGVLAVSGRLKREPGEGSLLTKLGEVLIQDRLTPDKIHKPSDHRSIYLCLMRSGEPEELLIFDLADPSLIVGARNITTVPSQALFLMNSPFLVEQARHFAESILAARTAQDESLDTAGRLSLAFRRVFLREPTADERRRATEFLQLARGEGESEPGVAAWAALSQSLFSANEFRYVD